MNRKFEQISFLDEFNRIKLEFHLRYHVPENRIVEVLIPHTLSANKLRKEGQFYFYFDSTIRGCQQPRQGIEIIINQMTSDGRSVSPHHRRKSSTVSEIMKFDVTLKVKFLEF